MKNRRWFAIALASLLAFSAVPAAVYAEEALPADEQNLTELSGELKLSGWAYPGGNLSADLSAVEPSWITSEDVAYAWSRTSDSGEETDLGSGSSYTVTEQDMGSQIMLSISGEADRGLTGSLSVTSYPVMPTEADAIAYAAARGDEDAIAAQAEQPSFSIAGLTENLFGEESYEDGYAAQNGYTSDNGYSEPEPAQMQVEEVYFEEPAPQQETVPEPAPQEETSQPEEPQAETSGNDDSILQETDPSWLENAEEENFSFDENGNEVQQPVGEQQTEEQPEEEQPAEELQNEVPPVYAAAAYTEDGSGTLDFGTLTEGDTDMAEEQFVSITNTGTGDLHFNMVAPEHFMVKDISAPLSPAETATVWVLPRTGLAPGEYQDTVTYTTAEGVAVSFTVQASVMEAPEEEPEEDADEMPEAGPEADEMDEESSEVIDIDPASVEPEEEEEEDGPELQPVEEADTTTESTPDTETTTESGTETETPSDTGTELPTGSEGDDSGTPDDPTEVQPVLAVSLDPESLLFENVTEGYTEAPAAAAVTVINTGNVTATLVQPTAQNFVIGALDNTTLAPGEAAVFSIQPMTGLPAGAYNETINILSAEDGTVINAMGVSFLVEDAPKEMKLTISPELLDFGVLAAGYSEAPEAQTVTVVNEGDVTLTLQQPTADNFQIGALSSAVLAPGESASFTVRPLAGLAEGAYNTVVTVQTAEGAEAAATVSFTVSAKTVALIAVVTPADITDVKNGTAKDAAALGLPQTVVIQTTNGDMNCNVVWDVNAASYDPAAKTAQTFSVTGALQLPGGIDNPDNIPLYTAVKVTVNGRDPIVPDPANNYIAGIAAGSQYTTESKISFTAVGAGLDNAAPVAGDVRYVPYKWNLVEDRTWDTAPYTATFRIAQAGNYTVKVTYNQQKFDGSTWTLTGVQDVKQVTFTVNGAGIATLTPTPEAKQAVATGDDTNITPLVIGLAAAVVIIAAAVILLIRRRKK